MAYNGEGTIFIPLDEFWEFVSRYHDFKGAATVFGVPRVESNDLVIDFAFSTGSDPNAWPQKPKAALQWKGLYKKEDE